MWTARVENSVKHADLGRWASAEDSVRAIVCCDVDRRQADLCIIDLYKPSFSICAGLICKIEAKVHTTASAELSPRLRDSHGFEVQPHFSRIDPVIWVSALLVTMTTDVPLVDVENFAWLIA